MNVAAELVEAIQLHFSANNAVDAADFEVRMSKVNQWVETHSEPMKEAASNLIAYIEKLQSTYDMVN